MHLNPLLLYLLYYLCQDLKPSNVAVNEDCELRVRLQLYTCKHFPSNRWLASFLKKVSCCTLDPRLWTGQTDGRRDDRICGHTLVPSARDHAELDALQPERCSAFKVIFIYPVVWFPFFRRVLIKVFLYVSTEPLVFLLQLISGQWGALWENCWRERSFFPALTVSFTCMKRVHGGCSYFLPLSTSTFHYFFKVPCGDKDVHCSLRPFLKQRTEM